MLGAVIFDFDGVITDTEILHLRSFNRVLARHNFEITTKDYYRDYLGLTDLECFKMLAEKGLLGIDEQGIKGLIEQKNHIFEEMAKTEARIMPDVRSFLEALNAEKIPTAICSGALLGEIEMILEAAQLRPFFPVIVSAEHIKKGKPDPEGFLLTLKKLNQNRSTQQCITANQCVVIEDSHWGLEAARAAGMHTIAITNSYDANQLSLGEKVVHGLGELGMVDLQGLCA